MSIYVVSRLRYPRIVIPIFTSPFYIDPDEGTFNHPYIAINTHGQPVGDVVSDGTVYSAKQFGSVPIEDGVSAILYVSPYHPFDH